MRKNNILTGIIIFDIITFFSFLFNPVSLVALGDLDFIFGAIVGVLFAVRSRKVGQGHLTLCLIVGIGGAFLSALSISIIAYWIYYVLQGESNVRTLFILIIFFSMVAGLIGIIIGGIIGLITRIKSPKFNGYSDKDFQPFKIPKSREPHNEDRSLKRD